MAEINVSEHNNVALVEVRGRIDGMNAHELGAALTSVIDGGHVFVVLDLGSVDFISSAGLRELVNGLKRAKRATGDLRLSQPSDRVREVLEMAGLDSIFRTYETQDAAVASY